jgi:aspartate dehydrogenase
MMLRRLGIIGCGGIAELVLATLTRELSSPLAHVSIFASPRSTDKAQALLDKLGPQLAESRKVHNAIADFLAEKPDVVAECASHAVVREHGAAVLEAGSDLVVISIGALADDSLRTRLQSAGQAAGAQLVLAPGAVGGIDALAAARLSGLESVVYSGRKPPKAWRGTAAEKLVDLEALKEPIVFFDGSARDAARDYPFNANVAATLALAGLGLDVTKVRLVADPGISRNVHEFSVRARCGDFTMSLQGNPSSANPKTSLMAGYSVARELINRAGTIFI